MSDVLRRIAAALWVRFWSWVGLEPEGTVVVDFEPGDTPEPKPLGVVRPSAFVPPAAVGHPCVVAGDAEGDAKLDADCAQLVREVESYMRGL